MSSYNLNTTRFTLLSDTVAQNDIVASATVNTLTGSDLVKGTANSSNVGVNLAATTLLDMGFGDDVLWGISSGNPGIGLGNAGRVLMGFGNDTVRGEVNGGDSNDPFHRGIDNQSAGLIDTGFGDDLVTGSVKANGYGIYNSGSATISTGFGRDVVSGSGGRGFGIWNDGVIDTGFDDDAVTGTADQSKAGFGGTGLIQMGFGNDRSEGFGTGFFDAGDGNDRLLLPKGTFSISNLPTAGYYQVSLAGANEVMNVKGYELVGAIGGPGTSIFTPGSTFTIA